VIPSFRALTAVDRVDGDHFALDVDPGSFIVRGPNGGYIAAVILRAMTARVGDIDGPPRGPRSLTVHYPAAPAVGPATVTTEVVRAGRSLVTIAARLEQGGAPMATALAAFSAPWPTPAWTDRPAPAPPGPDDAAILGREGPPMPFIRYWDYRFTRPPSGAGTADIEGWIRQAADEPIDAIVVAAMTDAFPPAVFAKFDSPSPVPTIDLTVHFRTGLPHPGLDAGAFVLGRFSTRTAANGFIEEDGELWAPDGTLLAQSRQFAVVLPG
jgi:hypothetical protein